MVIRVSGHPGSGKTTLCKRLADKLNYPYHYAGGIFREMAKERGMSIEDFYIALAEDVTLEKSVDARTIDLLEKNSDLIIEGRMAPFLPCPHKALNLLITVDPAEGARRNLNRPENTGRTIEEMRVQTEARLAAERKHYKALYSIDNHFAPEHYDIVVDTTTMTPDAVFEKVLAAIQHPPTP